MSASHQSGSGSAIVQSQSPLFRLPLELRRQIYGCLLHSIGIAGNDPGRNVTAEGEGVDRPQATNIIHIRHEDITRPAPVTLRPSYSIRNYRGAMLSTTYRVHSAPHLTPSILATCRAIHAEASAVLYSDNIFDFSSDVEAIVPFLGTLSAPTRGLIQQVKIKKLPQYLDTEFSRFEWVNAITALASLDLQILTLVVVTGNPVANFSTTSRQLKRELNGYTENELGFMIDEEGFEWMLELLVFATLLRELKIEVEVERCPPPVSLALERWLRLSKSIEGPFMSYLRHRLVRGPGYREG